MTYVCASSACCGEFAASLEHGSRGRMRILDSLGEAVHPAAEVSGVHFFCRGSLEIGDMLSDVSASPMEITLLGVQGKARPPLQKRVIGKIALPHTPVLLPQGAQMRPLQRNKTGLTCASCPA